MASERERPSQGRGLVAQLAADVRRVGALLALLWTIEVVDTLLLASWLQGHGIRPRTVAGLLGVLTAPWLHDGFAHLLSNSAPLFVLGLLMAAHGRRAWLEASLVIALVAGAGTWLIGGAGSNHIGASSMVFGWFGYLVRSGLLARSWGSMATAAVVVVAYGGLVWGVLLTTPGVSWQGHLFGLVGGWLAAGWLLATSSKPPPLEAR